MDKLYDYTTLIYIIKLLLNKGLLKR